MANKQLNNNKHVGISVTTDADDIVLAVTPESVGAASLNGAIFSGAIVVQAPVDNNNPATKQYVDNLISNLSPGDIGAANSIHTHTATDITSGVFDEARVPSLSTDKLTSGILPVARGGTGSSTLAAGSFLVGGGPSGIVTRTPLQARGDLAAADRYGTLRDISTSAVLVLNDDGRVVRSTGSSPTQITIPTNASVAFPTGTQILVIQYGSGAVTVKAASGVTLNAVSAGGTTISSRYQFVGLLKIDTNEWLISGPIGTVA